MVSVLRRDVALETIAFIVGSSVVLTLSFVGVLGTLSGELLDWQSRLPLYVVVMAMVFVASIFGLIRYDATGLTAMLGSIGMSLFTFAVVALAGEGVVFAFRFPDRVFGSQLVFYFLAGGMIATGLGYWLLAFWRDLAAPAPPERPR